MDESMDESSIKAEDTSVSILHSGSGGGPRRRYHRKDAKKPAKLEDPHAPRRPRSAYVHFLSSQRAKYGSGKGAGVVCLQKEINEKLAAEWRGLSDEDRRVFIDKSEREKEEYAAAMEKYVKTEAFRSFSAKKAEMKREGGASEASKASAAKNGGKKEKELDCNPKETGIFSEAFVAYNKEQETTLRVLRRQIGQAEDEVESLKRTSHSLHVNSEHLRESIKRDKLESDRLEDTIASWLTLVADEMGEEEIEDDELVAYLEDMLDNREEHKEMIEQLEEAMGEEIQFVVHQ